MDIDCSSFKTGLAFRDPDPILRSWSCVFDIFRASGWNIFRLARIYHWNNFRRQLDFGDLDLIFKVT